MNVGLKYRAELSQVAYLVDELDQIIATIRGSWGVQHKDDDTHSAITADSITTTGNAVIGGSGTFVGTLKAYLGDTVRESGLISSSFIGDPSNVGLILGGTTNGMFIEQRQSTAPFDGSTWELAVWNLKQSTSKPSLRIGVIGGGPALMDGGTGASLKIGDSGTSTDSPSVYAQTLGCSSTFTAGAETIYSGTISPSQLTADQNNYNPTGFTTSSNVILDLNAARAITGFAAGTAGQRIRLINNSLFTLTLKYNSGSSSVGNKMITPNRVDFSLVQGGSVELNYQLGFWFVSET